MRLRRFATLAATTLAAAASPLFVGTANAADAQPCGPIWNHATYGQVQTCPDWSPVGAIPVYAHAGGDADVVGTIDPAGPDWYICQARGAALGGPNGTANDWWAVTVADNGQHGVVNQVFFAGGGNFEPDGNLRYC